MAKWIYERWQPAWPEPLGSSASIFDTDAGIPINFDGSLEAERQVRYMPIAMVYMPVGGGTGTRMKMSTVQVRRYLPEQMGADSRIPIPIKDTLVDTIEAEEGAYPDDGVHSDQLYYVKVKPAFPTMRILRDGQWAEVETGLVLKDGVWKPIEEIYKLQDGQWVQA